jgi:hypothetical protein
LRKSFANFAVKNNHEKLSESGFAELKDWEDLIDFFGK